MIPTISFGWLLARSTVEGGTFSSRTAGIVGLGGGSLSLVSQLGSSNMENKFSYCFAPFDDNNSLTSLLTLGANSAASNPGAVSTPLAHNAYKTTSYGVLLEAVGVGDEKLFPYKGNVIWWIPAPL